MDQVTPIDWTQTGVAAAIVAAAVFAIRNQLNQQTRQIVRAVTKMMMRAQADHKGLNDRLGHCEVKIERILGRLDHSQEQRVETGLNPESHVPTSSSAQPGQG